MEGKGKGQLLGPSDITVDANGQIIVSEYGNCRISLFNNHGRYGVVLVVREENTEVNHD